MNLHLALLLLVPLMTVDASKGGVRSLGMWLVAVFTLCRAVTESCCAVITRLERNPREFYCLLLICMIVYLQLPAFLVCLHVCSFVFWFWSWWCDIIWVCYPCIQTRWGILLHHGATSSFVVSCRAWVCVLLCPPDKIESDQSSQWRGFLGGRTAYIYHRLNFLFRVI